MRLVIGGTRGTAPATGANFARFGGDTSSYLIEGAAGERIIVDAGTGIRALSDRLEQAAPTPPAPLLLLLLLTHYHLDHVTGFPSFPLLHREGAQIRIAAPVRSGITARQALTDLMRQPFWPVRMADLRAEIAFEDWRPETWPAPHVFGGLRISWCPLHHPGGCTAYRVDEPSTGASAVVATDVEWGPAGPAERRAFLDLCARPAPPRLLLFDGQFSRAESARFAGWGHSAWEDAVDAARETGAERLLVIHHGPRRDDGALAAMECEARAALPETRFARGGMEVEL